MHRPISSMSFVWCELLVDVSLVMVLGVYQSLSLTAVSNRNCVGLCPLVM